MSKSTALLDLSSKSQHVRLLAARFLSRHAELTDLPEIEKAVVRESSVYVQAILRKIITRLSAATVSAVSQEHEDQDDALQERERMWRECRREAVEWVSGLLLHEIASPVGLIERAAEREIEQYEKSKTKYHIDNVRKIFGAIEQLRLATAVPKPEEFDLAALISEIVASEGEARPMPIPTSLVGPRPLMIVSDPALIRLGIANGFRNAFEAVAKSVDLPAHPITITWGLTKVDCWVCIIDRGPGIIGSIEAAFDIGKSTKAGRRGYGLPIARQAIETLNGVVTLEPSLGGGIKFEARWEI